MAFHRFAVPSYTGGLPGGYDYLNNAVAGTPAPADGALGAGPNTGSYFMGQSEQASSAAWNRAAKALGENTDFLDDVVRRDLAVAMQTTPAIAPPGGTSSIVLTGPGIWVGETGTPNTVAGIRTFVQVIDDSDREIYTGDVLLSNECPVTSIAGNSPGDGFSAGNVTLNFATPIPEGTTYHVRYWQRSNLVTVARGALAEHNRRWNANKAIAHPTGGLYNFPAATVQRQLQYLTMAVNGGDAIREVDFSGAVTLHEAAIVSRDGTIILDVSGPVNLQLPDPTDFPGWKAWLVDGYGTVSTTNTVTLVRHGSENINDEASDYDLDIPRGSWLITSDGVNWHIRALPNHRVFSSTIFNNASLSVNYKESFLRLSSGSAGGFNLQLPDPTLTTADQLWVLQDITGDLAADPVTLLRHGSEEIQGLASNFVLDAAWGSWVLWCDGQDWWLR